MKLLNGVEIDGKDYDCSLVFSNNTVVSFMYIPQILTVERPFPPTFTKRLDRRLRGLNDNIEIK
jgi:hypothetical protein